MTTNHNEELCFASAVDLAEAYRARDLSPVELVNALLDRIEQINPKVNAFVTVLGEQAHVEARRAEHRFMSAAPHDLEPLCGMPVMVKDLTLTAGVRTTFGSSRFASNVPDMDGPIWARLKAAGAILLGKTTTPAWGMKGVTESPLTGVTNNPWDLSRTVGGSSGGSAAALAAGFGPLATGSDGGGSIRVPSAFCGVVGLKASPGRIPLGHEGSLWDTVDVVGPMTRTVADAALVLSAVAGPDPDDPVSLPAPAEDYLAATSNPSVAGWRVAFSRDLGNPPVEPGVSECVERAAQAFEGELGASLEQVDIQLPDPFEYFWKWWGPEIALLLEEDGGVTRDDLDARTLEQVERVHSWTAVDYARTQGEERSRIHAAFAEIFRDHDLLLMPTTAMVAFPHPGPLGGPPHVAGHESACPMLENQRFTEAVAHAGYPVITVPCGFTSENLPVGLQIAGRHGAEADVLRAAAAFEAAAPWGQRRPVL